MTAAGLAACDKAAPPADNAAPAVASASTCVACHEGIVESHRRTAHARTSAEASAESVAGTFAEGANVLRTGNPDISFLMTRRADGYYQTATDARSGQTRTERIDLVIGSGRRGQTYLFWANGVLVELPVSYLTTAGRWINSPGYHDGQVDFSRVVVPRCLECHATSFRVEATATSARYASDYTLGIACQKCHGDASRHLAHHTANPSDTTGRFILNPARLPRDRQIDGCALCHAGGLRVKQPPFSYRPGAPLDSFFVVTTDSVARTPDVHGDQVGLLRLSRCFRQSATMTCATCHDVHVTERSPAAYGAKCLQCHSESAHRPVKTAAAGLAAGCVDCHMPTSESAALQINDPAAATRLSFRSHRISLPGSH